MRRIGSSLLLAAALALGSGCMTKFGITRPIRQTECDLGGVLPGVAYGSPRATGWDRPSRPIPNFIINTDHPPEWYAEGY